jgi:hypothetical protein
MGSLPVKGRRLGLFDILTVKVALRYNGTGTGGLYPYTYMPMFWELSFLVKRPKRRILL